MIRVTVVFTNGNVVGFAAEEFNVDLYNTAGPGYVGKFTYKDHEGNNSAIHLKPDDVAGIFITPTSPPEPGEPPIKFAVASGK